MNEGSWFYLSLASLLSMAIAPLLSSLSILLHILSPSLSLLSLQDPSKTFPEILVTWRAPNYRNLMVIRGVYSGGVFRVHAALVVVTPCRLFIRDGTSINRACVSSTLPCLYHVL